MLKYLLSFFLIIIFSCSKEKENTQEEKENLESIKESINGLKTNSYDSITRNKETYRIHRLIKEVNDDSLKNEALFLFSFYFLKNNDSLNFLKYNEETFTLSQKLKDTGKIAEAYWDLAYFQGKHQNFDESFSNYSRAQKLYALKGMKLESGRMLLRMAIIQKNKKDFTGSEINTINAIRIFEPLKEKEYLYGCYNTLGIIYNELQEYDQALVYHQKAIEYQKNLEAEFFMKESTLNNIGVIYQNTSKYLDAINNFNEALQNKAIPEKDPRLYAMLCDNLAYSKMLLNDTLGIYEAFQKSLSIREKIQHKAGIAINKIHLAEYLLIKGDSAASYQLAQEAYLVSRESGSNTEVLKSLLLLSKLNEDSGEEFLGKYISLNDSLQKEERAIRNKFARISYETDEFIAENNDLNKQKRWMIFGFSGVVLLLVSVFVNRNQRIRNRELKLIQQQHQSNEEIYNLLIESQNRIEEGREKEKKRISRELHDGILSQFFGVRFNLESLKDGTDKESVVKKDRYINELKLIEKQIREVAHDLNADVLSSEKSFLNIVDQLLMDQEKIGNFKCKLHIEDNFIWFQLSPKAKINLFRIIQEAVHNINKHANAKNVEIVFFHSGKELNLVIIDDGCGFSVTSSKEGIGIRNMKMRIKDLQGSISINSIKKGTRIEINIPQDA